MGPTINPVTTLTRRCLCLSVFVRLDKGDNFEKVRMDFYLFSFISASAGSAELLELYRIAPHFTTSQCTALHCPALHNLCPCVFLICPSRHAALVCSFISWVSYIKDKIFGMFFLCLFKTHSCTGYPSLIMCVL